MVYYEKEKQEEIYNEFKDAVNMAPSSLAQWLNTEESKQVGWDSGDGESIGHKSGEHIIEILQKNKTELTEPDYKHMQKVNGYINGTWHSALITLKIRTGIGLFFKKLGARLC